MSAATDLSNEINWLGELNVRINETNKKLEELKAQKKEAEAAIIETLSSTGLTKVSSAAYTISLQRDEIPVINDWDAFYEYLLREKSPHLLQRRLSTTAVRELFEKGETVDGVDTVETHKLYVRRLK